MTVVDGPGPSVRGLDGPARPPRLRARSSDLTDAPRRGVSKECWPRSSPGGARRFGSVPTRPFGSRRLGRLTMRRTEVITAPWAHPVNSLDPGSGHTPATTDDPTRGAAA